MLVRTHPALGATRQPRAEPRKPRPRGSQKTLNVRGNQQHLVAVCSFTTAVFVFCRFVGGSHLGLKLLGAFAAYPKFRKPAAPKRPPKRADVPSKDHLPHTHTQASRWVLARTSVRTPGTQSSSSPERTGGNSLGFGKATPPRTVSRIPLLVLLRFVHGGARECAGAAAVPAEVRGGAGGPGVEQAGPSGGVLEPGSVGAAFWPRHGLNPVVPCWLRFDPVKTQETPRCEHQDRWQMDVHPAQWDRHRFCNPWPYGGMLAVLHGPQSPRMVTNIYLAMGQNPAVNISIPTKIGSKMSGAPTPKWDPKTVLTTTAFGVSMPSLALNPRIPSQWLGLRVPKGLAKNCQKSFQMVWAIVLLGPKTASFFCFFCAVEANKHLPGDFCGREEAAMGNPSFGCAHVDLSQAGVAPLFGSFEQTESKPGPPHSLCHLHWIPFGSHAGSAGANAEDAGCLLQG